MLQLRSWSDFDAPRWDVEGIGWPHREHSRFVRAAGLSWHVQSFGDGPVALLVHGTGAATHSWRGLAPELATRFRVVALDLPGHGFTERPEPSRMTLSGMGHDVLTLLDAMTIEPDLVVGHSAGAAILCRMAVGRTITPRLLVSLNGALFPFRGVAARVFSPIARLMSQTSVTPLVVAWRARDGANVDRIIRSTGSTLDAEGTELYRRLVRKPGHVASALTMMAHWDLSSMRRDLRRLDVPSMFLAGSGDLAVDAREARRAAALAPRGRFLEMPGVGHLGHEERPAETASIIASCFEAAGP